MKWLDKIIYTGLWTQPLTMGIEFKMLSLQDSVQITGQTLIAMTALSLLPAFYIYMSNNIARSGGKKKFGLLDAFDGKPEPYYSTKKQVAMYPEVPQQLIAGSKPSGIVLGKYHGKYVCRPIEQDGHYLIVGGSGSGKSSALIIPTLLINNDVPAFVLDIKGELSRLAKKKGDTKVHIFNPNDRRSYGYDPFYNLKKESTEQEILETMQMVTFSLISLSANVKDPFWKTSARNMLCGLMIYHFKLGKNNLVDIMDAILGQSIKTSIQEVMTGSDPTTAESRYLVQFSDMADETISGIYAEMASNIIVFANDQDIRYALKHNSLKCSPVDLENGNSIYVVIREDKLTAYNQVLQLIINQTLNALEKRPEKSAPILFLIDELPRILSAGKIERLLDASRTLRSRNVRLTLVTQSVEALMTVYSENEVVDLISNCNYKIILDASSQKTQHTISEWCGNYKEKKKIWNEAGTKQKTGISFEEKPIVEGSDLMTLAQTGEAILICPYGYFRIQKTPYYKDKILKKLADEVAEYNKTVEELHECKKEEKKDVVIR